MNEIEKARSDFRRLLWVTAFFSLFTNLLMLAIPLYMLQIYDRVLPSQSSSTLTFLSIIAALALLVLGGMEMVRSILATRMAARLDATLGDTVLRHVIRTGTMTGGSAQPLRDLAAVRNLIGSRQAFAILDLPFSLIFIGMLYLIHPDLFWLTLGGAVVLVGLAILNEFAGRRASREHSEASLQTSLQSEFLARNAESLVAMGMVNNVVDHWGTRHAGAMKAGDRLARVNATFTGISRFFRLAIQILILGYGALLVLDGEMTPGMIFASSIVSGRGLQPIDQIIGIWRQITATAQSWSRLQRFLSTAAARREYTALPAPRGLLEVADVLQPNALDPTARPVLARVSFRLEPGESVAVIGPSGSGKSTLARMIVGALQPRAGSIRIDGHEISNWDPEQIGRHIGYLAQDVELLPGTVAENISRFEADAPAEAIVMAARLAQVEDLIANLPEGYDTPIGPGGAQLSGGEKQRIGLARAFYGDPRIVVLDEPNSSLDRLGENALNKALLIAKKNGVTVFVITQRESVVQIVDKIMRINAGSITDFGDRSEILKKYSRKPGSAQQGQQPPAAAQPGTVKQAPAPATGAAVTSNYSRPVSASPAGPSPKGEGLASSDNEDDKSQ